MDKISQEIIELVEDELSSNGRRILEWIVDNRDKLDMDEMDASIEPLRNAADQAMRHLGIDKDPSEYLGYAIEKLLEPIW